MLLLAGEGLARRRHSVFLFGSADREIDGGSWDSSAGVRGLFSRISSHNLREGGSRAGRLGEEGEEDRGYRPGESWISTGASISLLGVVKDVSPATARRLEGLRWGSLVAALVLSRLGGAALQWRRGRLVALFYSSPGRKRSVSNYVRPTEAPHKHAGSQQPLCTSS